MRPPSFKRPDPNLIWELLTFQRLMTNQVIHLIYWAGLGVIALIAFGFMGSAVGVAIRDENIWMGILLAIGIVVAGLLIVLALALLWRSFCELYVALFRLSDDLHAMRLSIDAEAAGRSPPAGKAAKE